LHWPSMQRSLPVTFCNDVTRGSDSETGTASTEADQPALQPQQQREDVFRWVGQMSGSLRVSSGADQ